MTRHEDGRLVEAQGSAAEAHLVVCPGDRRDSARALRRQEEQVAERDEDAGPEDEALDDVAPDDRFDAAQNCVEDRHDCGEHDDAGDRPAGHAGEW